MAMSSQEAVIGWAEVATTWRERAEALAEAAEAGWHGERGGFHRGDHTQAESCDICKALAWRNA